MENKVASVCAGVAFLGLVSAALAFAGEGTKVKASEVQMTVDGDCIYPRRPAYILGLLSVLFLIIAQCIISNVSGCVCCNRRPTTANKNWTIGVICCTISWIAFTLAFLILLACSALNRQMYIQARYQYYNSSRCVVVKNGVFAGGGVLALATVFFGLVYYTTVVSLKSTELAMPPQNQGIVMGQPQIPMQSSEPVFVHEDTYNRRQFP